MKSGIMKGFIQNLIKGCLSFISSGHTQACWTLETFWSNYSIVCLFQGEIFVAIMFGVFGRIEMFGYLLFMWDMTCKSDPISKGLKKRLVRGVCHTVDFGQSDLNVHEKNGGPIWQEIGYVQCLPHSPHDVGKKWPFVPAWLGLWQSMVYYWEATVSIMSSHPTQYWSEQVCGSVSVCTG